MLLLYPLVFALPVMAARMDCSQAAYGECTRIADPLLKEPHLVFPDNMADIDLVCQTWNRFVDCLQHYTDNCFTDQQRRQFNKAVENPIESVHQMCKQPGYQKEYLQHAPCLKNTITERIHCGPHYSQLVEQVARGEITSKSTLCCSHDRFRQCLLRETRRLCDRGVADGPALRFAEQVVDKALSFLQDQCYNYIPNSGDCNSQTTDAFSDPLTISSSSSEIYPWSTIQENAAPKEILPTRVTPPKMATTSSWLPSSSYPVQNSETSPSHMLGSRTRPASYGRSSSWSEHPSAPNSPPGANTVQMYPEQSTTQSSRPDWLTVASWTPQTGNRQMEDEKTSTTWYPAAGSQLVNEVDEPNQQGLVKPKNGGVRVGQMTALVVVSVLAVLC